jgi:hypothetical protein
MSKTLTPRQNTYMQSYSDPASPTFGNAYKSARVAGYTDQTARNLTHLKPAWLSENIGQMATVAISPDELMATLASIIHNDNEPTIIRLKSIELTMKAYNMLAQHREQAPQVVTLNVDLSGN